MCEHFLSPDVLAKAVLRANEYGWRPTDVGAAVQSARSQGLAVVGKQAQFRLPDATCEPISLGVDPTRRRSEELWAGWVHRSAREVMNNIRRIMAETDWAAEVDAWSVLRDRAAAGEDAMAYLCFVLYFEADSRPAVPD
jgi:hypothetical protein